MSFLPEIRSRLREQIGAIPFVMREPLERYLFEGRDPGARLRAVVAGDLFAAMARSGWNGEQVEAVARVIDHAFPLAAYGTPEKVREWCARGGYAAAFAVREAA